MKKKMKKRKKRARKKLRWQHLPNVEVQDIQLYKKFMQFLNKQKILRQRRIKARKIFRVRFKKRNQLVLKRVGLLTRIKRARKILRPVKAKKKKRINRRVKRVLRKVAPFILTQNVKPVCAK